MKEIPINELSVVLPAYNEAQNVRCVIRAIRNFLSPLIRKFEIIVVDDGSIDGTHSVVEALGKTDCRIRIVRHSRNLGYGRALRSGFENCSFEWVFFTDCDDQFKITDLRPFLSFAGPNSLVCGYRKKRKDPVFRYVLSFMFSRILVPQFFKVNIIDVNCAFKLFPAKLLKQCHLKSMGALINAELLSAAVDLGYKIYQLPVNHAPRKHGSQTGGNIAVILNAVWETWCLSPLFTHRLKKT